MAGESTGDFSKGKIWKHIVALAVPMTVAQLVQVVYNIVDRIYIGHLPGASSLALTGLGLTFPVITLISAFTNLFGMGGAPLCSIARGRQDEERAEKIMGNTFTMLCLTSVILMVLCYGFLKPILYVFGASEDTFPYARDYLQLYLIGTPFVMLGTGMNGFINSQGFGTIGMMTVLLGAVANIILDPVFIFFFHMGVRGAALATILSQLISAIWILKFLTGPKAILKLKKDAMKLKRSRVLRIIGLGMSGFTMSITNSSVQVMYNAMLQKTGGDLYVGIMTVINTVREVISMPVQGITHSSQPVMGYNYGAKEYGRVKKAIVFVSAVSVLYTLGVWSLVHAFPEFFIRIFNRTGDLVEAGIPAMRIYFFGFFMMAFQFAGQAIFVGLGKAKNAVFFSIFRKVIIVIPLIIILPSMFHMGTDGILMAEPVSNFIGGTACFVTMLCTVWPELTKGERDKNK